MDAKGGTTADVVAPTRAAASATADASAVEGVYARLFDEGYRFGFYQAVRLLEAYMDEAPPVGETTRVADEQVWLRPHSGQGFPATDVRAVRPPSKDERRAVVTSTFMGLYGIASPLPTALYEPVSDESKAIDPLHDFLDVFNHRLYAFFYRAWKKYQAGLFSRPTPDDRHHQRFRALTGLPPADRDAPVQPDALLAFAGHLASPVRNAEGLIALLTGLFDNLDVCITENVRRWVTLPYRPTVGHGERALTLGGSAVIGERVPDVAGMFRLTLGPLDLPRFEAFLPGGALARRLDYLVRLYLPDFLHYEVNLLLPRAEVPPLRLGHRSSRLGLNTWLGTPADPITCRTTTY